MLSKNIVFFMNVLFFGIVQCADPKSEAYEKSFGAQIKNLLTHSSGVDKNHKVVVENQTDLYVTLASQRQRYVEVEFESSRGGLFKTHFKPCETTALGRGILTLGTNFTNVVLTVERLGVPDELILKKDLELSAETKIVISCADSTGPQEPGVVLLSDYKIVITH